MAAASSLFSEDQFLCSICLDVFTHPVTIPCGHNYCKNCITKNWNINVQCRCPMCKELFDKRPKLKVNTFISEMAAQFRQSVQKKTSSRSEQQQAKEEDVLCDVCTETKLTAFKSCLVCLTSYCGTHLELHQKIPGLKRHKLIDPQGLNPSKAAFEDRMRHSGVTKAVSFRRLLQMWLRNVTFCFRIRRNQRMDPSLSNLSQNASRTNWQQ